MIAKVVAASFVATALLIGCAQAAPTPSPVPTPSPTPIPVATSTPELADKPWVSTQPLPVWASSPTPAPISTPRPTRPTATPCVIPKDHTGSCGTIPDGSTPQPFRLTPTPTPTPQPTATPYPIPASKVYSEPEFISTAVKLVSSDDAQYGLFGRCLDDDEVFWGVNGIVDWTTENFQRRCLTRDWEYEPATDIVRARWPDAEFMYDASEHHFLSKAGEPKNSFYAGVVRHRFDHRLVSGRIVVSVYKSGSRYLQTRSKVWFDDCRPKTTKTEGGREIPTIDRWIVDSDDEPRSSSVSRWGDECLTGEHKYSLGGTWCEPPLRPLRHEQVFGNDPKTHGEISIEDAWVE